MKLRKPPKVDRLRHKTFRLFLRFACMKLHRVEENNGVIDLLLAGGRKLAAQLSVVMMNKMPQNGSWVPAYMMDKGLVVGAIETIVEKNSRHFHIKSHRSFRTYQFAAQDFPRLAFGFLGEGVF